jgi:hypothetical protein
MPPTVGEVMERKKELYPENRLDERIITRLHRRFDGFKNEIKNMRRLMYLHFLFRRNEIYEFVFISCDVFEIATLHEWTVFANRIVSSASETVDYTISRLFHSHDKLKRLYIKQQFKLVL